MSYLMNFMRNAPGDVGAQGLLVDGHFETVEWRFRGNGGSLSYATNIVVNASNLSASGLSFQQYIENNSNQTNGALVVVDCSENSITYTNEGADAQDPQELAGVFIEKRRGSGDWERIGFCTIGEVLAAGSPGGSLTLNEFVIKLGNYIQV